MEADVIVVGAGLAGLVATTELVEAGKTVLLVDQEGEQNLGGQAYWSFGGLFLVDSPQQRRMGIKDSFDLAWQDWQGSAQFHREEDAWPRRWAEAYVHFASGEKQAYLRARGHQLFPVVGWAERGGGLAGGHGNSVPRFHITWGTGPGIVEPFEKVVREGHEKGLVQYAFRHRVDELVVTDGVVTGVRGAVLEPTDAPRAAETSRTEMGEFEARAQSVIVTSGGIGGNHDLVRSVWPERLGTPPKHMISGVPAHVDGRMLAISEKAGASHVNRDRMWHYVEGIKNFDPIWPMHGIRILPGPSSLWLDGSGQRLPVPGLPGFDTLGTLKILRQSGHDHSWFVLTQAIIEKEFALSGQEQNPDLTGKSVRELLKQRLSKGATGPVEAFKQNGEDFVVADTLDELVAGMNAVTPDTPLDVAVVRRQVEERDREMDNDFTKDLQIAAMRQARSYRGDKLIRVASPHKILDPDKGPLIAVRLHVLTRKSLGGLETDLESRVLRPDGDPLPGLYAAGEVAGFGGGGVHGYNSLEGTFLGGCIFSGRAAGQAAARAVV
ncbi:FAD-binding dehydrogenase [Aeromicrobium sp. Root495]|uniref:FAD-binding dehydrogenase n=1 Tax=Aeromicrobium sp. Root495 TaxID=1736550 RepID=UPI0006F214F3|nr:FAD-binding dehydrogenase [Aeromicrobium sp. Root495]KQY59097.1 FAD-binding dehydrogenase [Aeromicrobium sp. Root495]